jgi:hypothetical protein
VVFFLGLAVTQTTVHSGGRRLAAKKVEEKN